MSLPFTASQPLSIGVEVELQLIDPTTWDLRPESPQLMEKVPAKFAERVKPEIFQSMIEINTGICKDAHAVRTDLYRTREALLKLTDSFGLKLATTGTHPFARYSERKLFPSDRYRELIDRNQWIARRIAIFGIHVHLGMESADACMAFSNTFQRYLPLFLALSASSPFWQGEDTGLASSRGTIFEAMPTAGHVTPLLSWHDFEELCDRLLKTKSITSVKDLWWDIRPSPSFGTLEIRICDGPSNIAEVCALVALIHSVALLIQEERTRNTFATPPPLWWIRENKWRAIRHGIEADFVTDDLENIMSVREVFEQLFTRLEPIFASLKYQPYRNTLEGVLGFPSYRRQRNIHTNTGRIESVVELNCLEFQQDRALSTLS